MKIFCISPPTLIRVTLAKYREEPFNANANNNEKIIENLKSTDSIDFNFEQNTNGKREKGNCTIEYPKKIFCQYSKSNNKILVSNGKSLVIKNQNGKEYFRYRLDQTSLALILSKDVLLKKMEELNGKVIDNKYYIFYLENNENKINIFFDKNTFNLVGWQTEDVYQNLVITYIFNLVKNSKIDKKLFVLPETH